MSKTHEGFYSIFENGSWGGGVPYSPQALPIESESLGVGQDLRFRDNLIGNGRTHDYRSVVPVLQAPKGAISYAFKSDDSLKVLFSHFQYGSYKGSTGGTYQYSFYPSKGNPTLDTGIFGNGSYGGTGRVYSVSILKRLTKSGTNSLFFKNGICDTLRLSWDAGEEFRLQADYVFRSVDTGTAYSAVPDSASVGSYSRETTFQAIYGTVLYNGTAFEVEGLKVEFKNNIEPSSRVGARNPESFKFGRYEVSGELKFDFPTDGIKYIGSMIGTRSFALSFGASTSGSSSVNFTMPNCVLAPFEVNADGDSYNLALPFKAFESGTLPPIQADVYTSYFISGFDLYLDAENGARVLGNYEIYDAGTAARILGEYEILDRDE